MSSKWSIVKSFVFYNRDQCNNIIFLSVQRWQSFAGLAVLPFLEFLLSVIVYPYLDGVGRGDLKVSKLTLNVSNFSIYQSLPKRKLYFVTFFHGNHLLTGNYTQILNLLR